MLKRLIQAFTPPSFTQFLLLIRISKWSLNFSSSMCSFFVTNLPPPFTCYQCFSPKTLQFPEVHLTTCYCYPMIRCCDVHPHIGSHSPNIIIEEELLKAAHFFSATCDCVCSHLPRSHVALPPPASSLSMLIDILTCYDSLTAFSQKPTIAISCPSALS